MNIRAFGYPLITLFVNRTVDTVREVFAEGHYFCNKIVYRVGKNPPKPPPANFAPTHA